MWNTPSQSQLSKLPLMGSTENVKAADKKILMHFFINGSDWYIAEYSPETREFFGYAVLNGDWDMSEWGYISFDELIKLKSGFVEVDRDLHWKPVKFSEVKAKRGN